MPANRKLQQENLMRIRPVARLLASAALMGGLAVSASDSMATTRTSNMAVTATVVSACAVSTATMDFGSYTTGTASNKDVAGSLGYTGCTGLTFTLELGLGANAAGTVRKMKDTGTDLLTYELYKDAAHTQVFGSGTNGLSVTAAAGGTGTVAVQGRIPFGAIGPARQLHGHRRGHADVLICAPAAGLASRSSRA
jgi:spore coat protein U-like protein